MAHDVSLLGPLNIDLLIVGEGPQTLSNATEWDGPATVKLTSAGAIGYTAEDLGRMGLAVRVTSILPEDSMGRIVRDVLMQAGVTTDGIKAAPGESTGIGAYVLLFGSRKRPLAYQMPTHQFFPTSFDGTEVEALLDARVLHCGGYLHHEAAWHGQIAEIFGEARHRGIETVLDPQFPLVPMDGPWISAMEDLLPQVQYLLLDENEARSTTGEQQLSRAARRLLEAGTGTVVVKCGADGAYLFTTGAESHQQAWAPGPVQDTIGAGDAFDAGFILGICQGWEAQACLKAGVVVAGYSVTGTGGSEAIPNVTTILGHLTD